MKRIYVGKVKKRLYVFEHIRNAYALSPNKNTCANESFNLILAPNALKMFHY